MNLQEEIKKRRTFAIISHPDAGKTTITEQLLYFGGEIREAGTVKGKKTGTFAKSDWMDIEKQRGISVTSSVMQFDYDGKRVNILDTPGHEDFSEDTYRTLMAVDAAVMVVDSAKGIEAQTKKLFEVVKHRGIPVFTFMNKLDRDGREPLDLLQELEEVLGIASYPMNWPIGMGKAFEGLYDLYNQRLELYKGDERFASLEDGDKLFGSNPFYEQVKEDIELLNEAGNEFSEEAILTGELTPVFFGSALTNFGVQTFLETFLKFAPEPHGHKKTDGEIVDPYDKDFSGFVFKIQANMDPRHRDRIAFVRIVSGEFERGMSVNLPRTGKGAKLSNVTQFMAESRENVTNAVAGDIIGVYDTGTYQVGDCAVRAGYPAACAGERLFDQAAFIFRQSGQCLVRRSEVWDIRAAGLRHGPLFEGQGIMQAQGFAHKVFGHGSMQRMQKNPGDHVPQLAGIARPGVSLESLQHGGGKMGRCDFVLFGKLVDEILCEEGNVIFACA